MIEEPARTRQGRSRAPSRAIRSSWVCERPRKLCLVVYGGYSRLRVSRLRVTCGPPCQAGTRARTRVTAAVLVFSEIQCVTVQKPLTSVVFCNIQSSANRVSRETTTKVTETHIASNTRRIMVIAQKKLPIGKTRQNCRHALLLGRLGCRGVFGDCGSPGEGCWGCWDVGGKGGSKGGGRIERGRWEEEVVAFGRASKYWITFPESAQLQSDSCDKLFQATASFNRIYEGDRELKTTFTRIVWRTLSASVRSSVG